VLKGRARISWGIPAQIADSKDGLHCGRCGSKRGVYGKDFGIWADGNLVPVVDSQAFDITITEKSVAALCWRCLFSFLQTQGD